MKESPLYAKVYDFLLWLTKKVEGFPRGQRFIIGSRLVDSTLALHRKLVHARKVPSTQRSAHLLEADILLEEVRLLLRIAHDHTILDTRAYEHGAKMLTEVGRMLGSWLKS